MLQDHTDCVPDYYTPILITSEAMIKNKPDVVRAFMKAVSKGYQDAISNPNEAAGILLKAAPELNPNLVKDSQAWLSPRYQADAPRWGEQKLAVWQGYSEWMAKNKIIDQPIDAQAAFTNDFLP
jgi:ABC-type nitrate/sulfonate/bicarbonate transport system substrate-binding protein